MKKMNYKEALKKMFNQIDAKDYIDNPFVLYSYISDLVGSSFLDKKLNKILYEISLKINVFNLVFQNGIKKTLDILVPYAKELLVEYDQKDIKLSIRGLIELFNPNYFIGKEIVENKIEVLINKKKINPQIINNVTLPSFPINVKLPLYLSGTEIIEIKVSQCEIRLSKGNDELFLKSSEDKENIFFNVNKMLNKKKIIIEVFPQKDKEIKEKVTLFLNASLKKIKKIIINSDSALYFNNDVENLKITNKDNTFVEGIFNEVRIETKKDIEVNGFVYNLNAKSIFGNINIYANSNTTYLLANKGMIKYLGISNLIEISFKKNKPYVFTKYFSDYMTDFKFNSNYNIITYQRRKKIDFKLEKQIYDY